MSNDPYTSNRPVVVDGRKQQREQRLAGSRPAECCPWLSYITCGKDPDEFFAYPTTRFAVIRDRRLGLLYYTFILTIVLYVVVYVIAVKRGYMATEIPLGTVRLSVQVPDPNYILPPQQLHYCTPNGLPNATASYTYQGVKYPQIPCRYMDPGIVTFPALEQTAVFLSSRIRETQNAIPPQCVPPTAPECLVANGDAPTLAEYFVAEAEYYLLLVDHGFFTDDGLAKSATDIDGLMVDHNGNEVNACDDYPPGLCPNRTHIGQSGHRDFFPFRTMLRAAGVDYDTQSYTTKGRSKRYGGVLLAVLISYTNTDTYNLNYYSYKITPTVIVGTEFRAQQLLFENTDGSTPSINMDRHGIRVLFFLTGEIGAFEFQAMLVNLVSSAGLIAAATFVVDRLMLTVMRNRKAYGEYKYLQSVDFSDFDQGLVKMDDMTGRRMTTTDEVLQNDSSSGGLKNVNKNKAAPKSDEYDLSYSLMAN